MDSIFDTSSDPAPAPDLPRIGIAPLVPDAEVIESLEMLLARARSGELRGIAYIGYGTDSDIAYGYVGREMASNYLRTYALLHWLADKAMQRWKDRDTDR